MAKTINKVELLGRVGSDPEMKYTASGVAVTQLRLATDRVRKGGEAETDWHSVVVWDKLADAVAQYVEKGQRIYVAGRLVQNSWTGDDGQRRHRTEIHAQDVVFLDSVRNGNGGGSGNNGSGHHADTGNGVNNGAYHQPADEDSPF
ncbi:MAG: single-stranded DNA-binding protein [Chloroflexi bacterium]|nr:single-stranded DNA-binding protein [Chloroflexota bacterium]